MSTRQAIRFRGLMVVGIIGAAAIAYKIIGEPFLEKRKYIEAENEMRLIAQRRLHPSALQSPPPPSSSTSK